MAKSQGNTRIENRVEQVHVKRNGKIAGQPRQQEKESVVVGAPSQRQPVNLALSQKVAQRRAASCFSLVFHLSPTFENELKFVRRQSLVLAGIAVDQIKQHKIEEADEARGGKAPAPAEMQQQQADQRDSNCSGEFCCGIGERRGQSSFLSRKPVPQGFGIRRKGGGFAHAQKQARSEEPTEAG